MLKRRTYKAILTILLLLTAMLPAGWKKSFALSRRLVIAFNSNLPPYQFVDENGEYAGIHIEMMQRIAAIKNFEIELTPMATNRECNNAL